MLTPARATADTCKPRADLAGDPDAVARVGAELALLGVERGTPAPGCRGVYAQVALDDGGGIAVAVRDGARRSEGRVVGDAAIAASWIDSWLHDDLDGHAWLYATPAVAVTIAPPGSAPVTPVDVTPVAASAPLFERFAFGVAYEQTWLADGATASGVTGHACVRVGRACIGGRVRYAREADKPVNLTAMGRRHGSVLATASTAVSLGRMTVSPEVGVGIGWTATRRVESCMKVVPEPTCNPMDPMDPACSETCVSENGMVAGAYVGDEFSRTTVAPRASAALRLAIPLFDRVWLDGIASATFAPLGHADPFVPAISADGTNPGMIAPEDATIPGEPSTAFTLGIGLRVGAP